MLNTILDTLTLVSQTRNMFPQLFIVSMTGVNAGTSSMVRFRPLTATEGPTTGPVGVSAVDVMTLPFQLSGRVHTRVAEGARVEYTRTFVGDSIVGNVLGEVGAGSTTAGRKTAPWTR